MAVSMPEGVGGDSPSPGSWAGYGHRIVMTDGLASSGQSVRSAAATLLMRVEITAATMLGN